MFPRLHAMLTQTHEPYCASKAHRCKYACDPREITVYMLTASEQARLAIAKYEVRSPSENVLGTLRFGTFLSSEARQKGHDHSIGNIQALAFARAPYRGPI